jgi:ABC-type antimicrobial peptide transport system ATPase subunit
MGNQSRQVEIVSEANRWSRRLTEQELRTITSLLAATDDEEDREIKRAWPKNLTDDERERVRHVLALELMERGVQPDGSVSEEVASPMSCSAAKSLGIWGKTGGGCSPNSVCARRI